MINTTVIVSIKDERIVITLSNVPNRNYCSGLDNDGYAFCYEEYNCQGCPLLKRPNCVDVLEGSTGVSLLIDDSELYNMEKISYTIGLDPDDGYAVLRYNEETILVVVADGGEKKSTGET
ncbi:MAG: hypothetical protein LBH36_02515 [Candidatus Nomurabacteria bacterium]|nr:hypothetical protein [Candidatus Nomurabacteria bacterium]